jgi:hypothetical protein
VSLYNPHIATMEADPTKAYNQDDATGFIRLNALRLKVAAKVHGKKSVFVVRAFVQMRDLLGGTKELAQATGRPWKRS